MGADLAVGDVQSLGLPMAFGGPYAGYMCSTEKLMRKLLDALSEKRMTTADSVCSF